MSLGDASRRGDHDIGQTRDLDAVDLVHQFRPLLPGGDPVAGEDPGILPLGVGHDVDDKIRLDETGDLHHVLVAFIAPGLPRYGVAVRSGTQLPSHGPEMVLLDGPDGAETGDDALASPAVPHHVVVDDPAGQDDPVGLGDDPVDRHLRSPARLAEVDHVLKIPRVVVDHVHPPADLLAAELFHLLPAVLTMASDDDQDADVFVGDTRLGRSCRKGWAGRGPCAASSG